MGCTRLKKFLIILIFTAIIGVVGFYLYSIFYKNETSPPEPTQDNNSTVSIHTFSNIPENLREIIQEIASENDWKIVDESADVYIGIDSSDEEYRSIYQFWVVTKDWSQLAISPGDTISQISENIDEDTFGLIDQTYFSINTESNSGLKLETLNDIDSTRIAIDIANKSTFEDSWWENKNYPLTLEIEVWGNERVSDLFDQLENNLELTSSGYTLNYPEPNDFVEIIKTGTTVAGGPGWQLCENSKGILSYPIDEVKETMENADISMISNESSFVEGCSQPAGTTAFCGKPTYIQNLLDMGIDIVSLTGNHMNDYGRDYFSNTMQTYLENDILYFASGENSNKAWEPLIIETTAGTIAFLGYNRMGPDGIIATDVLAGTAYYDQEIFLQTLNEIVDTVDIIWLDTHLWPEYGISPSEEQIALTQEAIDNSVDIVTGVSSHEVQGITFYNDKPVFYGLGNFLFDQMWSAETRLSIVLKIHLFNGTIANVDVLPTRMHDYCQPRFLTGSDKTSVLEYLVGISEF